MRGRCTPETAAQVKSILAKARAEQKADREKRMGVVASLKNSPLKNSTPKKEKEAKAKQIAKRK